MTMIHVDTVTLRARTRLRVCVQRNTYETTRRRRGLSPLPVGDRRAPVRVRIRICIRTRARLVFSRTRKRVVGRRREEIGRRRVPRRN